MAQQDESRERSYPTGRGYGHDYMRGGEVLGGYGYSERAEYEMRRGELQSSEPDEEEGEEPSWDAERHAAPHDPDL